MRKPVTTIFGILNIALLGVVAMLHSLGHIEYLFIADQTGMISIGVAILLVVALICQSIGAWRMDRENVSVWRPDPDFFFSVVFRLPLYISKLGGIAGVLGMMIGLASAVEGLPTNLADMQQASAEALQVMRTGLATAFATTIIGLVARIWIEANWYLFRQFARLPGA